MIYKFEKILHKIRKGGIPMQSHTKTIIVIIGFLFFSLTGIIASHAGSGDNQPGTTPTVKYLPDLQPISLFFDKDCNLMVKIKNVGKGKFVGPHTGFRFYMDGNFVGASMYNLILFPNSTVTKLVSNRALLGVWVKTKKNWKYAINEKGPIQGSSAVYVEESNDTNNSITKQLVCGKFLQINPELKDQRAIDRKPIIKKKPR
jgi:hypothetical protein